MKKYIIAFATIILLGALLYAGPSIFQIYQGGTGQSSFSAGLLRSSGTALSSAEMSGDGTTSGSNALTLASVVTAGTCGDTTHSCGLTYDVKGRITAATNNTISGGGGGGGSISVPTNFTAVNGAIFSYFSSTLGSTGTECFSPGNNTLSWRFCDVSLAASPFTVTAQLDCRLPFEANSSDCGVYLYDGTKLEGFEALSQASTNIWSLRVEHMATVTTDTATVCSPSQVTGTMMLVRVVDNSTSRVWSYSLDGSTFTTFCTVSSTNYSFITPNKVGFGGVAIVGQNGYVSARLLYWSITNP